MDLSFKTIRFQTNYRSSCIDYSSDSSIPTYEPYSPAPRFDLVEMHNKAETFAKSHAQDENVNKLQTYIQDILNNPTFQSNPKDYLKNWKSGASFPELIAREFFDENFSDKDSNGWCTIL